MILRGCPKKWLKKSQSKLSAVGPHFPIDMTWERLILLSLSRNNQKDIFHAQGVPATEVWTCGAPWLQHYPVSNFFWGHPVHCQMHKRPKSGVLLPDWLTKQLQKNWNIYHTHPICHQTVNKMFNIEKALTTFGMKKCDPLQFLKWDVI